MHENRRGFFGNVVVGMLAVTGWLVPRSARAFGRRRRMCQPVYLPPACAPTPVLEILRPLSPIIPYYPTGGTVPGNGGFYAWGTTSSKTVAAMTATCNDVSGKLESTPLQPANLSGQNWTFRFDNVPPGSNLTLAIYGQDLSGGTPTNVQYSVQINI